MAVVVSPKTLKKPEDPAAILRRPVRQLMPGPVIQAIGNNHVFVDVEGRNDSLCKHIHDVVVSVGATVEFGAECTLPLLGLQNAVSVRRMKHETFEIQFADATNFWSRL